VAPAQWAIITFATKTTFASVGATTMNSQLDLFGFPVGYTCHKCGKSFNDMSAVVRHAKRIHKNKPETTTQINFALENYCLISTKKVSIIAN